MRTLALIAFIGLQLSMFTCETNIHIDHLNDTTSQIVQLHNGVNGPGTGLMDRACQIHASHVFTDQKPFIMGDSETFPERIYHLATLNLVNVPHLIEHPPRFLHS
ncbi:MAG: hypothetical protein BMS9Abin18_0376 [Zetaproteobacteria bacterium]|nr:MAG: hypothetical protein BMS9Abin18_0376 [Zetaproteobacteria bacterium]